MTWKETLKDFGVLGIVICGFAACMGIISLAERSKPIAKLTRPVVAYDEQSATIIRDLGLNEVQQKDGQWHLQGFVFTTALRHEAIDGKLKCWYDPPDFKTGITHPKIEEIMLDSGMVKQPDGSWKTKGD